MIRSLLLFIALTGWMLSPSANAACTAAGCKIVVVGDMGIGDDAFAAGFDAVQQAMVLEKPDLVLYAGDYIYAKSSCLDNPSAAAEPPFLAAVREKLVKPFNGQVVFVPGDNDRPGGDNAWAVAARSCWQTISGLSRKLSVPTGAAETEGLVDDLPGVLVVALDSDALAPERVGQLAWMQAPIKQAKAAGKWVLVLVHAPVVTTAWYEKPCCASLKPLHDMGVDLVFSGHQHSFERSHQLQIVADHIVSVPPSKGAIYQPDFYPAGNGVVYVVAGGGGAWLRPFADQQASVPAGKVAPPEIHQAIARRAVMNHYVNVDLSASTARVTTKRVCAAGEPRWRPTDANVWPGGAAMLECHGKPAGVSVFERVDIKRVAVPAAK